MDVPLRRTAREIVKRFGEQSSLAIAINDNDGSRHYCTVVQGRSANRRTTADMGSLSEIVISAKAN
jgi:hypothetical protein